MRQTTSASDQDRGQKSEQTRHDDGTHARELVLVTGAAGGIGRETCAHLIKAGYSILGLDIEKSVSVPPAHSCGWYRGIVADTRDENQIRDIIAAADTPVRHVVTCAGIALAEETQDGAGRSLPTPKIFRGSVDLNLTGHYVALEAAWPVLRKGSGNRSVTFCSSINALQSYGLVGYSAAKAGLIGLAHALVVPLGEAGIRVNVVAPGTIPTPATQAAWSHVPDHFDRMRASVPLGQLGTPGDVATAVVSLVRDLRHVSGHTLVVDGGQSLAR